MEDANFGLAKPKGGRSLKKAFLLLVLAGLVVGGTYFYIQYKNAQKEVQRLSNPQEAAKEEAERLTAEVARLYQVPDEVPTVATVVDASKLKDQPFFAKAENQDRVLIFTGAKRAILYRPSTKKIIEVAPINIGNNAEQAPAQQ